MRGAARVASLAASIATVGAFGGFAAASAGAATQFSNTVFASGAGIEHRTPTGREVISQPDDITYMGGDFYVAFQNGVGPQGEPSSTGNPDSTIVKFDLHGKPVKQWDIVGKSDGLTADPALGKVIATVNEDANSSIYLIDPVGGSVHYSYNKALPSDGGTDAITLYRGMVLISASAPGTTGASAPQPTYPAVYAVTFDSATRIATVSPLFFDEDVATVANENSPGQGKQVHLALTDPDSNERVPWFADRFAGDFMLTSQGDEEQIFVSGAGTRAQKLSVLTLTRSVDDSAWPTVPWGSIFATDGSNDTINRITGPFVRGIEYVAVTPCDQANAPGTCPGPGFPANYFGQVHPNTGVISKIPLSGPAIEPKGMLFLP
jgi:hypothetical protein